MTPFPFSIKSPHNQILSVAVSDDCPHSLKWLSFCTMATVRVKQKIRCLAATCLHVVDRPNLLALLVETASQ